MNKPLAGPVAPLAAAELCRRCAPERFEFSTTAELPDLEEVVGQPRALGAIEFGVGIRREGYNLFAMGPEGVGRHTIVRRHLEQQAKRLEAPSDWCYVLNFDTPHRPRALRLPAGAAPAFKHKMERLVEDLRAAIPSAFETDEYRTRRQEIESELGERQEKAIGEIGERARAQGIGLLRTPTGFGFAPIRKDKVMSPEEFHALPEAEQKRLEELISGLQEELERAIHELPKVRREALRRMRELNRQVTRAAVDSLIEDLKAEYRDTPQVQTYLAGVQNDVLDHAEVFRQPKDGEPPTLFGIPLAQAEPTEVALRRYQVNVLMEHAGAQGAPIVYEDHPSHDALVGRIEHIAQMGALVTDFTLIKAGALHRANGGYLILDALKVLTQPLAWEALKRALRSREVRIQSLGQELSLISTVSLDPEPIPLDLKVVLVGQRFLYYLLHAYDPEFAELFKVAADFDEDMPREPANDLLYARTIATLARKDGLRPLERSAVARVIDHASRDAGDAEKISVKMRTLADLLRESDYWAGAAGRAVIGPDDVARAIETQIERAGRVRERLQEHILRGSLLIDTSGERVGQANGLAVMQLGDYAFGSPHRITARARLGGGGVVDIERESELGGPIHSKGVLILSGFLTGRYATRKPLSLSASLVFEQSYGGVEGDSASSAELYALLSALADAPLRQSLAVTGSVNQHGDVQAIGGVNEKIEGFFDVCRARGLSGDQGVLIPRSNVKNLMLRRDVVDAVAAGRFAIYPVATVDEGIEILAGLPAGEINRRVEERLADYAERSRAFGAGAAARKEWRAKAKK
ncbi:MAG: ATP-dependent protease [Betaproteobacteria bacterium RIFCSPLOWO2_12_FULL_68_20]|nr:MAG: ATP-dependent protease [Betaproteobacteria bacterium RIFCSPLOWO2_12_FULL_68_20]